MSRIAGIVQLLSGGVDGVDRVPNLGGIGPKPLPPNAVPTYIVVCEVLDTELQSLTGRSGLVRTVMQVECWDRDYEAAWTMRESVKALLLPFHGDTADQRIDDVKYNTGRELFDDKNQLHQVIGRFFIWWNLG